MNTHPVLAGVLVEARHRDLAAERDRDRRAAQARVAGRAAGATSPRTRAGRIVRAALAAVSPGLAARAAGPA